MLKIDYYIDLYYKDYDKFKSLINIISNEMKISSFDFQLNNSKIKIFDNEYNIPKDCIYYNYKLYKRNSNIEYLNFDLQNINNYYDKFMELDNLLNYFNILD
tara:strand:+ start:201 stop:506 length:306 start_codon:yes stop_codon:yes gene_type:complete